MTDDRIWFVADGHTRRGPMSLEALREELARRSEGRTRFVWREGMAGWATPDLVPELSRAAAASPAAAAPSRASPCSCLARRTRSGSWSARGSSR